MRWPSYNKSVIIFFILYIIVAVKTGTVLAQEANSAIDIDINTAVKLSLEASEDYLIKRNLIDSYREKYKEIKARTLPQVNLESIFTYNGNYPVAAQVYDYESSSTISASQLLWAFGKVRSAVRAAQQAFAMSRLEKDAVARDIIYNAKYTYYVALLALESYRITSLSYENAVMNKQILQERSVAGRASKRDNIKISADLASRIPQVNDACAQMKAALNSLKRVTGLAADKDIRLTDSFALYYGALDYDFLEGMLLSYEPELKALEAKVGLRDTLVNQAKAEYMPTISAFGSCSYAGGRNGSVPDDEHLYTYTAGGVKVNIPVFTSGETAAKLEQARIEKANARLNLRKLKENLLLQLRNAVDNYHAFTETLKANNEAVRLARESFELTQELFRSGQVSVTDLNDAELMLTGEEMNRLITLFNINITLAEIERLTLRGEDDE